MTTRESINEQAANWLIQLNEPGVEEQLRADFAHWKALDPRHAAAVERLQGFVGQMSALRPQKASVHAALDSAYASRNKTYSGKRGATALLLLIALLLPGWALWRSDMPSYWLADLHTAPAQWLSQTLPDQSHLTLNGNSAVDLHFDDQQRRIRLLRGEVLVEVAHDPARPFIVETEQGQMRALGTRFVVKRENGITLLTMLESRVAATASANPTSVEVGAGEQARISATQVQLLSAIDPGSVNDAWRYHQLVVQNQPLPEVLDELARQHPGHVQFDREALADLRVSAVLPLDNSQRALQLIADALPVRVRQFSPWLVIVSRKP